MPDGVMVAQLILVQFVLVRIQVGQPFHENNLMESVENSPSDIFFAALLHENLWAAYIFYGFVMLFTNFLFYAFF